MSAGSFTVFDTSYAANNAEILRWTSVAIAGFLTIICLIWAAMVYSKDTYKADLQEYAQKNNKQSNMFSRQLLLGLFFILTIASTFLSWYIASLHVTENNLIALDVLNILIVLLISIASYFYYKTNREKDTAKSLLGQTAILELVSLVLLLQSPTAAGTSGSITQSALYAPIFIATLCAMTSN